MSLDDDEIELIVHSDLTNRARGGIVIYILAWLIIMLPNQVAVSNPGFFYLNSTILVLILVSRLAHYFLFLNKLTIPVSLANNWLVYTILAAALHWGLMSGWILLHESYAQLDIYVIVTAAVLGIAGTTALSISKRVRILFPIFMMTPMIGVLLLRAGTNDLIFGSMAILSLGYVYVTSKTASQDYWRAIHNQVLARQHATEMERLSVTDQLTQLKNRSYFDARFREEWKRGDRLQSQLSLLMIDLDHFKSLNDRYGHVFGDLCLQRVAQTLVSGLNRETDILARYGGEEFVVLLPDTNAQQAAIVAERLRRLIAGIDIPHEDEVIKLTCSIGGASACPDFHEDRENLLKQADQALYLAKELGRNQYQDSSGSPLHVAGNG